MLEYTPLLRYTDTNSPVTHTNVPVMNSGVDHIMAHRAMCYFLILIILKKITNGPLGKLFLNLDPSKYASKAGALCEH
jgi:hypothetical protein